MTRAPGRASTWGLAARVLWVALRLIAVFYLGQGGARFFDQGF